MIHSKNQMIRSMKSYQEGGASDDSCMEEYMGADGKKRKRKKKGGCGKKYGSRGVGVTGSQVGNALLSAAAATAAGLGLKKMLDQQKKGGAIKKVPKRK